MYKIRYIIFLTKGSGDVNTLLLISVENTKSTWRFLAFA